MTIASRCAARNRTRAEQRRSAGRRAGPWARRRLARPATRWLSPGRRRRWHQEAGNRRPRPRSGPHAPVAHHRPRRQRGDSPGVTTVSIAVAPESHATGGNVTLKTPPRPANSSAQVGGRDGASKRCETSSATVVAATAASKSRQAKARRRPPTTMMTQAAGNSTATSWANALSQSRRTDGSVTMESSRYSLGQPHVHMVERRHQTGTDQDGQSGEKAHQVGRPTHASRLRQGFDDDLVGWRRSSLRLRARWAWTNLLRLRHQLRDCQWLCRLRVAALRRRSVGRMVRKRQHIIPVYARLSIFLGT